MTTRTLTILAVLAIVIVAPNFMWFVAESGVQGGDALNGYAADGHFFVCAHGACTEIAPAAWEWSRAHAVSVLVTLPVAVLGAVYLVRRLIRLSLPSDIRRR